MAGSMPRPRPIRRRFIPTTTCRRAAREKGTRAECWGLMVRDARRCRAPHHEGFRPHPEEARSAVSKDEATARLLPRLHELQNLVGQARIRGIDRIDFRDVAVLRQHVGARASARALAACLLDEFELFDKAWRIEFGG